MTTLLSKCDHGLHFKARETEIFSVGQELVCPHHRPKAGHVPSHTPSARSTVPSQAAETAYVLILTGLQRLHRAQMLLSFKQEDDETQATVPAQQSLLGAPFAQPSPILGVSGKFPELRGQIS